MIIVWGLKNKIIKFSKEFVFEFINLIFRISSSMIFKSFQIF